MKNQSAVPVQAAARSAAAPSGLRSRWKRRAADTACYAARRLRQMKENGVETRRSDAAAPRRRAGV